MARFNSPKSSLLAVALAIFLMVVAASLLKRCHGPLESGVVSHTQPSKPLVETAGSGGSGVRSNPPTAAPSISETPEAKPEVKKRRVQVTDIFGAKVRGAHLVVARSDGLNPGHLVTTEEGRADIPEDSWEDSFIHCGDFHITVKTLERGVPFQIPGISTGVFGELAVLPRGWDQLRISRLGQNSWHRAAVDDEVIGHRFLYLLPGTYEIADPQDRSHGTAEVRAGQRTTFTVSLCAIRLNLAFAVEPDPLPFWIPIKIQGLSHGTTHPKGYKILMMVRSGQRTFTEHGLAPGAYEVTVDDETYGFHERVILESGNIKPVDVRLNR